MLQVLDIAQPDPCCNKRLTKDLASGKVQGDTWTCPKCSVEWLATLAELDGTPYRRWAPHCPVIVFRT